MPEKLTSDQTRAIVLPLPQSSRMWRMALLFQKLRPALHIARAILVVIRLYVLFPKCYIEFKPGSISSLECGSYVCVFPGNNTVAHPINGEFHSYRSFPFALQDEDFHHGSAGKVILRYRVHEFEYDIAY